ncbi:hypothetical protein ASG31_14690 [Chryseobacterium sp. Leaf404]|uniref:glycosyltransferase family 2 protein n=1 Tax=unclassified Chryseobacterium TaxID=2593645 RepID=UPI0006F78685|nr:MULTISPECIES: glycosyltransferase [unclassified Chryseobacterium]KQT15506.1 hypothetical protein ASG31_14690 [Chryseobacterium sp. Leaf404]
MPQSLISIIVPCYNQAQYLDECLQSVLVQTYQNWECIIVNDGSPDNTEEVSRRWTNKDSRFKYLKKENGGLSSARNFGIENSKGEWILPLDSDDKISKNYLKLASDVFSENYTIIYSNAEYFGLEKGIWGLPEYSASALATNNIIFCSAIFKKNTWYNAGGYDESMKVALEDWEFWIRILKNGGAVHKINQTCFYYRIKNNSMIAALDWSVKEPVIKYIEQKHIDFFQKHFGTYHELSQYKKRYALKNTENKEIKKKLASKRYIFIDRLLSFFNK